MPVLTRVSDGNDLRRLEMTSKGGAVFGFDTLGHDTLHHLKLPRWHAYSLQRGSPRVFHQHRPFCACQCAPLFRYEANCDVRGVLRKATSDRIILSNFRPDLLERIELSMELTKSGVSFTPDEIEQILPLFRKVFPSDSALELERKALSQKLKYADETKIMDGTSELCTVLDTFYEKVKSRVVELGEEDGFSRTQFMFFAMNVSDEQLGTQNG